MSQLSEVWDASQQGTWKKCPKYGYYITGCARNFECERCVGKKKIEKCPKKPAKEPKKAVEGKRIKRRKTVKRTQKNEIKPPLKANKVSQIKLTRIQRTL